LNKFVEKQVDIVTSEFFKKEENIHSDITMGLAKDLARDMFRDAIKSGEFKPYDEDDLVEILNYIPEGLLDDEVNEGISELENDPACQEELSQFNNRKDLEEYVKRVLLETFLLSEFSYKNS
jgi:hypothetical protein